uniref:Gustatory receptor 24 n=1 Tax=Chouioia cunea TaxID=1570515 RepID=A0A6B9CRK8_9HYME|nr:gustatory receptor 24 [Chouioia cunea]
MALLFAVIVIMVTTAMSLPPVIRIGAIFTEDQKDSPSELAFKYAVYKINKEKVLLPNTTMVYDIQYVPKDDSFRTSKKACKQMSRSVQGLFGPADPLLGAHVQSICEALDVPHLEARVDFEPSFKEFSINLYPAQDHLNRAFRDLMSFLNWTKVAIIYEEDYGLFKLQDLVKAPPSPKTEMYIRQAGPGSYRQVLREVRHKEIYKLIIDTDPMYMQQFFRAILQLQMNDYRYHYMFTSFDIETFDLEDFKYNSVNMTAFRLVDLDEPTVADTLKHMERFQPIGHTILNRSGIIQAEPALVYDSVQVLRMDWQRWTAVTCLDLPICRAIGRNHGTMDCRCTTISIRRVQISLLSVGCNICFSTTLRLKIFSTIFNLSSLMTRKITFF